MRGTNSARAANPGRFIYTMSIACLSMGHDVIVGPTSYDVQWGAHQEMLLPYREQAYRVNLHIIRQECMVFKKKRIIRRLTHVKVQVGRSVEKEGARWTDDRRISDPAPANFVFFPSPTADQTEDDTRSKSTRHLPTLTSL